MLILPMKGKPQETALYGMGVTVTQQTNAVVNGHWFVQNFILKWKVWQATAGGMKILVYDFASSHFARQVLHEFEGVATKIAAVPGGLTPILQHIDTDVAFVFHHWWQVLAHEWETTHPTTKLNAVSRCIAATKLCAAAWKNTLQAVYVIDCVS